ncbi:MAG: acyl-CoA dehydrogenase family protein [Alcaligenaceae bacterium]
MSRDTTTEDTISMVRDAAHAFCTERSRRIGADADTAARLWSEIAKLGWLGVSINEDLGGSASGLPAAGVIACELGRAGYTRGYAETVAIATALTRAGLQTQAPVAALIRAVATGSIQLTFLRALTEQTNNLDGQHGLIPDAGAERLGVLRWSQVSGLTLCELDRSERNHTVRTTSRATDLIIRLEPTDRGQMPKVWGLAIGRDARLIWDDALMLYRCLAAAQLVGTSQAALAVCIDYAKVRTQFGHVIGTYQAVQHTLVDILAASDAAELLTFKALSAIDQQAPDQASIAAAATAFTREAAWNCLMKTYDVLGGVGFMEEHPINILTRAMLPVIAGLGSAHDCEDRVATHVRSGHWLSQTQETPTP